MFTANPFDLLLITAQLSVAIAGFSTLATTFRQPVVDEHTQVNIGRVLNMMVFGFGTAALSLIPFIPHLLRLSETLAWQISAGAALTLVALLAPQVVRRLKRMSKMAGYYPRMTQVAVAFDSVAVIAFVFCLCGKPSEASYAMYIVGVLSFLSVCGILFFGVIGSMISQHVPR